MRTTPALAPIPRPVTAAASVKIGVLTDLHLSPNGTADDHWIHAERLGVSRELTRRGLQLLYEHEVNLIALLGDLTHRGEPSELAYLLDELSSAPAPVIAIAGNHDLNQTDTLLSDALADRPGHPVRQASLAGRHLRGIRFAGGHVRRSGHGWDCTLDQVPKAVPWTAGDIVIWLAHHPVISLRSELRRRGLPYAGDLRGRRQVLTALRGHDGPVVALTGHLHVRAEAKAGNVLQLSSAALVEYPHEASVVEVTRTPQATVVTRRALTIPGAPPPRDPSHPPALLTPAETTWRWHANRWQSVRLLPSAGWRRVAACRGSCKDAR